MTVRQRKGDEWLVGGSSVIGVMSGRASMFSVRYKHGNEHIYTFYVSFGALKKSQVTYCMSPIYLGQDVS